MNMNKYSCTILIKILGKLQKSDFLNLFITKILQDLNACSQNAFFFTFFKIKSWRIFCTRKKHALTELIVL